MENIIREAIKNHGLNKLKSGSDFWVYTNLDGVLKDSEGKVMPKEQEIKIREWHNLDKNLPIYAIFYCIGVKTGNFFTASRTYHISSCILKGRISFRTIIDTEGWDKTENAEGFIGFSLIEEVTCEKISFDDEMANPNSRFIHYDPVNWSLHHMRFHILNENLYITISRIYFCNYDISEALNDLLKNRDKYYEKLYQEIIRLKEEEKYEELIDLAEKKYNKGEIPFQKYYFYIIDSLLQLKRYDEANDRFDSFQEEFNLYSIEDDNFDNIALYYLFTREILAITCKIYDDIYYIALCYQDLNEKSSKDFSKEKNDNYNTYITNFNKIDSNNRRIITTSKTTQLFKSDHITLLNIDNLPDIKFPITHPKQDHTYICHPYKTDTYLPIEEYDYELLNDRINEFCYLLQCLGAISISIENVKGESSDAYSHTNIQCNVEGKYKIISAKANAEFDGREKDFSQSTLKIERNQHFNPTKKPFVPEDLVWYPHQVAWQRLVQQRMNGNLLNHSEYLSSSEQKIISNSEMVKINGELDALFAGIKGGAEFNMEYNIENNNEMEWRVNVTFKPMEEFNEDSYGHNDALPVNESLQIEESITDDKEQQYMEEIRFMLDDNGMIDERERMMLDRMINVLGISPERAQQLEMLVLSENELTREEKEYLEKYKVFIENGEVSDRERQMLIRFANLLGISEERALELEKQA
jgi:hypothetical protein